MMSKELLEKLGLKPEDFEKPSVDPMEQLRADVDFCLMELEG